MAGESGAFAAEPMCQHTTVLSRGLAMLSATLRLLALALLVYAGFALLMFFTQRSLVYLPQPRALGAGVSEAWLEVEGVPVQLSVLEQPGAPALLYFGGNAEDVSRTLPSLAQAFPGHALYLMHYRGYGGSDGRPSEAALVADALALHDRVAAAGHPSILLIGRSLGSGVAMQLASRRAVDRLVLVTPFDSLVEVGAGHFPWLPVRWLLRDRYESAAAAKDVSAPALLIAAGRDDIIPPRHAEALHRAFPPGRARLELLEGVGHNDVERHPRYWALLVGEGRGLQE
jgi:pimeloyl-ACP methyl ester carboxylesterase